MALEAGRIVMTGGAGFLGRYVVEKLSEKGCKKIVVPRRSEYDLTREENVARLFRDAEPDVVIHLAAVVGGIGANRKNPGKFVYENLMKCDRERRGKKAVGSKNPRLPAVYLTDRCTTDAAPT